MCGRLDKEVLGAQMPGSFGHMMVCLFKGQLELTSTEMMGM